MLAWFTGTAPGLFLSTFCISMVPVLELRAGLPFGLSQGLPWPLAFAASVAGNLLPAPFIILFIRKVFVWLRRIFPALDRWISRQEQRAAGKSALVAKYGPLGLCILVAIPLPGTGAWTGALVAALLDLRLKRAMPAIILGVLLAALLVSGIYFGLIHVL